MQVQENYSLLPYNSFHIEARARYFAAFSSVEQLGELADFAFAGRRISPALVLGGGSNILLQGDLDGWVFHNQVKGISVLEQNDQTVLVTAGAGENWNDFVQTCISNNWAGLENLSLIPGSVGAAPMQNIGAYGVELKDHFHSLEAWHLQDRKIKIFDKSDCDFGYRESVFKKSARGEYIILSVNFVLNKIPVYNTAYGAIAAELEKMGVEQLSIRAVADAVIRIRQSKLPDPKLVGNAGSFFKNPSVSAELHQQLKLQYPELVAYPNNNGTWKLAAGWLIEQCGWKGYREGDAGCHARQALVLVNYGKASGRDILALSKKIQESVEEKFAVLLEPEVNVV